MEERRPRAKVRVDGPVETDVVAVFSLFRDGARDPTVHIARPWAWLATRTPAGPVTVAVRNLTPHEVEAHAWGPGAESLFDGRLAGLCGFLDLDDLRVDDPFIARQARRRRGLRFPRGLPVLHALPARILGQKVTTIEAHRSWARMCHRLGEPAPGPTTGAPAGLRLPPSAERLANLAYHELHPLGVERRRADIIIRCARRAAAFELAAARSGAALTRALESMAGVGPWTSSGVAQVCAGDRDAVVLGDLHIPSIVGFAMANEPEADDARMLELLAPYAGQRGFVQRLIKASGRSPGRTAPKAAVRRFERM